ncbi:MAG: GNAT family protein [Aeromicrobium sp.]
MTPHEGQRSTTWHGFRNAREPTAAFPARERHEFMAHWTRLRGGDSLFERTVEVDGVAAGNVGSWNEDGQQLLGYWFGRDRWGRGIATQALALFADDVSIRTPCGVASCMLAAARHPVFRVQSQELGWVREDGVVGV